MRLVWAAVMIVAPRRLLRLLSGSSPSSLGTGVVRFLGLREAAQVGLTIAVPRQRVLSAGAATDGLHALSMAGLAAASERYRRPALVSGLLAATSSVVGALACRQQADQAGDQIAA